MLDVFIPWISPEGGGISSEQYPNPKIRGLGGLGNLALRDID